MKTTLNKIRAHSPCHDGWQKLLRGLGKTQPDDETLWIDEILDHNGLGDALWCLRAVENCDREIRLYAVWCVRRVQHLANDPRSIAALDVVERHARGDASDEELGESQRILERAKWRAAADAAISQDSVAEDAAAARARARSWAAIAAAAWAANAAAAWAAGREAAAQSARDAERAAQVEELRRICREMRESGR